MQVGTLSLQMASLTATIDHHDPAVAILHLTGEHDAYSANRLQKRIAGLLDEGLSVVVDLCAAEFIDSATLGALLSGRTEAEEAELGFVLRLCEDAADQVQRIFAITGLTAAFAVEGSIESALEAARAGCVLPSPHAALDRSE